MEHDIDRRRIAMRSPTRARHGDARRRSRIGRPHARAFIDRIKREWEPYFDRRVQAFGTERARCGAQRSFPL
ncbi:hypothetical protein WS96_26705 [Burkholderia sp. MSMB1835]|nr:hypothetical protein WS96_26705 [Burkholderia sp. MSMB1835]